MARAHKKKSIVLIMKEGLFITIGAILMAVALELFLVPNKIIDGGIAGISILLSQITAWPLGLFLFFGNLPFLMLGYKQIGKTFAISSLYGLTVMSVMTFLLHRVPPFTTEPLLTVFFGGMILGAGVGLVIRYGGSLDGSEIVAILISKRFAISVGEIIMFINFFIFIIAGFRFGWDSAMYSMISYYVAYKVIDVVVEGLDQSKSVTIISQYYDEISEAIMDRLGRSTTFVYAKGGYKKEETQMIYCVVTRLEVAKLKSIVDEIDHGAFIAIEHVADVLGGSSKKKNIH